MADLTPKQEKFVQNMVKGMSQRQAYRGAYDSENMSDLTVDKKASGLFKQENIRGRYHELVNEAKNQSIWTREMAMDELKWLKDKAKASIEENGVRQANSKAFVDSVKELNVLGDVYPKGEEGATQENDVAETLKKLVDHFGAD